MSKESYYKKKARFRAQLRVAGSLFLLCLFLSVGLSQNLHIYLDEDDHHDSVCLESDKENACHITVYHNDVKHGCQHAVHLGKLEFHCSLCDMIADSKTSLTTDLSSSASSIQNSKIYLSYDPMAVILQPELSHYDRGPPFV